MKYIRPFLKYPGGKYRLLGSILKYRSENKKRFVDVFCGSAVVGINSNYNSIVLNDINEDLINILNIIKSNSKQFIKDSNRLFKIKNNDEKKYYEYRNEFNSSTDPYRKSVLLIYLNRHCFNGVMRYNKKGDFNVPFGKMKSPYFPKDEIIEYSEILKNCTLSSLTYSDILTSCTSDDIIYCDPPYIQSDEMNSIFSCYSGNSFNIKDHELLVDLIEQCKLKGSDIIISNHDTDISRNLYKNASIITELNVTRSVNTNSKSKKVKELIAVYN